MKTLLSFSFLLAFSVCQGQWTIIATDDADDSAGLDGTLLEYYYDIENELVLFRVTCTNLADYSTGPAADFSFYLPEGLESGNPSGTHWTSTTPVHKTAFIYCDAGGQAPDNYTFNEWPQTIEETNSADIICTDCVGINVDVGANQITYTFNRADIISNGEMIGGTNPYVIGLVANVGHNIGWNDALTHDQGGASDATFEIDITLNVDQVDGLDDISVHPNPAKDQLNLSFYEGITNVTIVDVLGKTVAEFSTVNQSSGLDISNLESGTYLLQIFNKDGLIDTPKFVKK